ncbi:DUF1971 domain-containing protein [Parasedimentitalea huanghaiensis]|uniref:DUF1971 domain-containing protein n=1 Tax=Parasedimentitalea huanghaiensis TaxID=2682100 RepID=A0A6L6WE87_9RHOB|nr:DUF1971 domain-containing protein [Zongyanglinia huanghaiensis]MVO16203.1 DUF1971 domain-containing protein [Zongyanglinia huanghaiensis]
MTQTLPANAVKYSESPLFTQDTIPEALRRDHNTKPGVWGQIVVSEGTLNYLRENLPAQQIPAGQTAVIWPQELHKVAPIGSVAFKVEFYRIPDAAEDQT